MDQRAMASESSTDSLQKKSGEQETSIIDDATFRKLMKEGIERERDRKMLEEIGKL